MRPYLTRSKQRRESICLHQQCASTCADHRCMLQHSYIISPRSTINLDAGGQLLQAQRSLPLPWAQHCRARTLLRNHELEEARPVCCKAWWPQAVMMQLSHTARPVVAQANKHLPNDRDRSSTCNATSVTGLGPGMSSLYTTNLWPSGEVTCTALPSSAGVPLP